MLEEKLEVDFLNSFRVDVLCNRIREYRNIFNMRQSDLADLIGVSQTCIVNWESGAFCPTAYMAALLCDVFRCSFEDLFFFQSKVVI